MAAQLPASAAKGPLLLGGGGSGKLSMNGTHKQKQAEIIRYPARENASRENSAVAEENELPVDTLASKHSTAQQEAPASPAAAGRRKGRSAEREKATADAEAVNAMTAKAAPPAGRGRAAARQKIVLAGRKGARTSMREKVGAAEREKLGVPGCGRTNADEGEKVAAAVGDATTNDKLSASEYEKAEGREQDGKQKGRPRGRQRQGLDSVKPIKPSAAQSAPPGTSSAAPTAQAAPTHANRTSHAPAVSNKASASGLERADTAQGDQNTQPKGRFHGRPRKQTDTGKPIKPSAAELAPPGNSSAAPTAQAAPLPTSSAAPPTQSATTHADSAPATTTALPNSCATAAHCQRTTCEIVRFCPSRVRQPDKTQSADRDKVGVSSKSGAQGSNKTRGSSKTGGDSNKARGSSRSGGTSQPRDENKKGEGESGGSKLSNRVFQQNLQRMKVAMQRLQKEEHTISVYTAEGWKGSSREKVQLSQELARAAAQQVRWQSAIQECVRCCEEAQGFTAIPDDRMEAGGAVAGEEIFCSVCLGWECEEDNDIVLCDGPCNRAYHQHCMDPPLDINTLEEDVGWLCYACACKEDIVELINEEMGSSYDIETPWHDVLTPNADQERGALGPVPRTSSSPSAKDKEEDEGERDSGGKDAGAGRKKRRRFTPAANGWPMNENGLLGIELPSEDEEDSDFDVGEGSDADGEGDVSQVSGSGHSSSESDEEGPSGSRPSHRRHRSGPFGSRGHKDEDDHVPDVIPETGSDLDAEEQLPSKRMRATVDYRLLNDAMFGDAGEMSEDDEDFAPC